MQLVTSVAERSLRRRFGNEPSAEAQNMAPKSTIRSMIVTTGLSTGRESYDNGTPIVVRAGESPVHGEGE